MLILLLSHSSPLFLSFQGLDDTVLMLFCTKVLDTNEKDLGRHHCIFEVIMSIGCRGVMGMEICNPMLQSKQTHIPNVPYEMLQAFFLYLFVILVKQIKYTYFIIKLRFPISNNRCCRLKLIYVFIKNILH